MKKSLKKITAMLLMGTMIMGFAACGNSNSDKPVETETENPADEVANLVDNADGEQITVGIVQLIDNGAFEDMRNGFIAELRDQGYGEDVLTIDYKNAQGDATALNTICQTMISDGIDLIAAIATPSAQAIVNMESDIPVIFISVSNPVGAGIITDMELPDKNATGTSNAIPVNEIIDLADLLTPGVETYGFLYSTSEINSMTTVENTKEYLDSVGLKYEEATVSNSSEVQQAAQSLVGKVDAFFIPNDSVIQSAMPLVAEVAMDAQIPAYASSATTVESGAFATIAISDEGLGRISAGMAIQYLTGTPIAEIPAIVVPADDMVINKKVADALGLTFSDDVMSTAIFFED